MRLIAELFDDLKMTVLDEGYNKKGYYIEGVWAQSNVVNRNKRMYPKAVLETALTPFQKLIEEKRALGELGHPAGPAINLDRVSHLITRLEWNGNNVVGRAKVLDTPNGNIVKNFIDEGVKFGVSTRALGSVKLNKEGIQEVQNDMQLATADIVADPSAPDAWVQGLFEGKEWVMKNGIWTEQDAVSARDALIDAKSGRDLNNKQLQAWTKFIDGLKQSA